MPAPVDLVCIDPARVSEIWPEVAPLLHCAIVKTGVSAWSPIECEILNGRSLLWVCRDGARILCAGATALERTDAGLICVIVACGGTEMHRWLPLLAKIEAYAKAEGCRATRIIGREGWGRLLDGYDVQSVILQRELA